MTRAQELIEGYGLKRHPEGGWFAEVYTAPFEKEGRPLAGSIYFLLDAGERMRAGKRLDQRPDAGRVDAVVVDQKDLHSICPHFVVSVLYQTASVSATPAHKKAPRDRGFS